MSRSPTWPAPRADAPVGTGTDTGNARHGTPTRPTPGYRRLTPLQTAAATSVIFTSLVVLAAMTGIFSFNGSDEPALLGPASNSPLRSSGGPVPQPVAAPVSEPPDMITEVDAMPPPLRPSSSLALEPQRTPVTPAGSSAAPRTVPARKAPPVAAVAPAAPPKRNLPQEKSSQQLKHHAHTGKTREQVIEELMQSKRDGSYRALQENYR